MSEIQVPFQVLHPSARQLLADILILSSVIKELGEEDKHLLQPILEHFLRDLRRAVPQMEAQREAQMQNTNNLAS